jgi:predicted Zn-ribbon and HTH transcriptional regulator
MKQVVVRDVHRHPYGKSGKSQFRAAIHPQQHDMNYHKCAACGFPVDLDRFTKCPFCSSECITYTKN